MPPRNGGRFFSDSTFAPLLTLLTLADDSHDKVWTTPAAGHHSFCPTLLKPPLNEDIHTVLCKKKKGGPNAPPISTHRGVAERFVGGPSFDNQGHVLAVIGHNWDKLSAKKKKKWTLTSDARRHCTPSAPPLPPPQTHPHPPSLPGLVPRGEEALSLIKQAVAMK